MRKLIGNVRKSTPWQSLLLLLFLTPCLFPSSAFGESYSYTDIHPPGWIESRVTCLNGRGGAVGCGTTGGGRRKTRTPVRTVPSAETGSSGRSFPGATC